MNILYLECNMGAAGDMLCGALLELMPDWKQALKQLNELGIEGVTFQAEKTTRCGISGLHVRVEMEDGQVEDAHFHDPHDHCPPHHHHHHEEGHPHEHPHVHPGHDHHEKDHSHHHHHTGLAQVEEIIAGLHVSDHVKEAAAAIFEEIARAEAHAHQQPIYEIHFHEVGTMDAIADVTACCWLLEQLSPDRILASPVCTGYGHVHCAHGILPVPAPAAAFLLQGIPIYAGQVEGELCTPTGAAILRHFVEKFEPMPLLKIEKTGYGMGSREFPQANCVRAFLGQSDPQAEDVVLLECTLDDMSGEEIGYALNVLLEEGALDVYTQAIGMKKNRPGILLTVLARPQDQDHLLAQMFKQTTTLGVRILPVKRQVLQRSLEVIETPFGPMVEKRVQGFGVKRAKVEFEDLAAAARENDLSLMEVKARLKQDDNSGENVPLNSEKRGHSGKPCANF